MRFGRNEIGPRGSMRLVGRPSRYGSVADRRYAPKHRKTASGTDRRFGQVRLAGKHTLFDGLYAQPTQTSLRPRSGPERFGTTGRREQRGIWWSGGLGQDERYGLDHNTLSRLAERKFRNDLSERCAPRPKTAAPTDRQSRCSCAPPACSKGDGFFLMTRAIHIHGRPFHPSPQTIPCRYNNNNSNNGSCQSTATIAAHVISTISRLRIDPTIKNNVL